MEKLPVQRREFLKMSSLAAAASVAPGYLADASAQDSLPNRAAESKVSDQMVDKAQLV
jgi:hypothetical protein